MPSTLLANGTLLIDDRLRRQADRFAEAAHDRSVGSVSVRLEDGSQLDLPDDLSAFVGSVLSGLARGAVSVMTLPDELTTTMAAELLGVSRPTLMKWVNAGELAAHKVGSHTRVQTADVISFRGALMSRRREALDALRAWDEADDE